MSSQPAASNATKRTTLKRITNGKHKRNSSAGPSKRPAFILKLWTMVNDPSNEDYIQWTPDGESFKVLSKENFEKVVLPKYFKHSNYSSFVRQLNMYGWHKVQDITSGAMQSGDEIRQFKSPYFIRGREELLDNIVRNKSSKGSDEEDETDMGRILDELDVIKANQLEIASDLNRIRSDNQMLWREAYESRERHKAHAETFERILRFLASLYSNNPGKFVNDTSSPAQKQQRLLLPNLSELSNGQISELSFNNLPLSAIEELISNNASSDKFSTPSKSRRISTVSNEDPSRIGTHISDIGSTETSPQSLWSEPADETKSTLNTRKSKPRSSITPLEAIPAHENNIYTSPNPSALSFSNSSPASNSFASPNTATPAALQRFSSRNGSLALPLSSPLAQTPVSSANSLSLVPSSDPFSSLSNITETPEALGTAPAEDIALTPLINDALYNANQEILNDDRTTHQLLNNEHDIESIIRNINYQEESLERLQDRIQHYTPYKEESNPLGSPAADATFDVNEFLMNSASDIIEGGSNENSGTIFEDMGPPQKRSKVKNEK